MRACIVGAFALLACAPLLAMAAAVFDSSASWLLSLNDFHASAGDLCSFAAPFSPNYPISSGITELSSGAVACPLDSSTSVAPRLVGVDPDTDTLFMVESSSDGLLLASSSLTNRSAVNRSELAAGIPFALAMGLSSSSSGAREVLMGVISTGNQFNIISTPRPVSQAEGSASQRLVATFTNMEQAVFGVMAVNAVSHEVYCVGLSSTGPLLSGVRDPESFFLFAASVAGATLDVTAVKLGRGPRNPTRFRM